MAEGGGDEQVYGGVDLTLPGTVEKKSGHQRISSVDGLGHMEALLKEGTELASVAAKRQRQRSHAPPRDRNRAVSRSPKMGTLLDRRDGGKEEGSVRPCPPETGSAPHHEPNSARARSYGSGQPSASGRGTMFASSLSNRGPHMVMSDAAMDIALKRQRDAIGVFSPRCSLHHCLCPVSVCCNCPHPDFSCLLTPAELSVEVSYGVPLWCHSFMALFCICPFTYDCNTPLERQAHVLKKALGVVLGDAQF